MAIEFPEENELIDSALKLGGRSVYFKKNPGENKIEVLYSLTQMDSDSERMAFFSEYEFIKSNSDRSFLPTVKDFTENSTEITAQFYICNTIPLLDCIRKHNNNSAGLEALVQSLLSVFEYLSDNSTVEFTFAPVSFYCSSTGDIQISAITTVISNSVFETLIAEQFRKGNKANRSNWISAYVGLLSGNISFCFDALQSLFDDPLLDKTGLIFNFHLFYIEHQPTESRIEPNMLDLFLKILKLSGETGQNSIRKRLIDVIRKIDPTRMNAGQRVSFVLENVSNLTETGDYRSAAELIESLTLKDLNTATDGTVHYYLLLSKIALNNGQVKQSLSLTETALAFCNSDHRRWLLDIHFQRYRIFSLYLGQVDEAYQELTKAFPIMEELGDPLREGILFNALALHYYDKYETENAIDYAQRAEKLLKNYGGWFYYSNTLGLLGIIALRTGNYEAAISYLLKSKSLRIESGDHPGVLRVESNIAITQIVLGQFEEAELKLSNILAERLSAGYKLGIAFSYLNLGRVKFYSGEESDAVRCFEHASEIAQKINNQEIYLLSSAFLLRLTLENKYEILLKNSELIRFHKYSIVILISRMEFRIKNGTDSGLLDLINTAISMFEEMNSLDGYEQEFFFVISQSYECLGMKNESVHYLKYAYHDLRKKADNIDDPIMLDRFLNHTPINRIITEKYSLIQQPELEEENKMIQLIYDLTTGSPSSESLSFLENIAKKMTHYFDQSVFYIFLKNENGKDIDTVKTVSSNPASFIMARKYAHQIILNNEKFSSERSEINTETGKENFLICVPIISGNNVLGVLTAENQKSNFSEKQKQLLGIVSALISNEISKPKSENISASNTESTQEKISPEIMVRRSRLGNMIGNSSVMQKVYRLIDAASKSDAPVLITGESGTGKEVAAKAIHAGSNRKNQIFIPLDCGAVSENLLESELFGYKKGAFTGAVDDKIGLFEAATKGVLFLDEITNTTLSFQARLLRVLQEGEIRRIGETVYKKIDTRIISASNVNVEQLIAEQKFRHDLFYRLNVITIDLPPLRERKDDIPLIINEYLSKKLTSGDKRLILSKDVMTVLMDYSWPGNVRELINEMEKILVLTTENYPVTPDDLSAKLVRSVGAVEHKVLQDSEPLNLSKAKELGLRQFVESIEAELIRQEIKNHNGKLINIAKSLKLANATLSDKLKKYGLSLDAENP